MRIDGSRIVITGASSGIGQSLSYVGRGAIASLSDPHHFFGFHHPVVHFHSIEIYAIRESQ